MSSSYLSFPLEVTLEVTYQCNLSCLHCYLPHVVRPGTEHDVLSVFELKGLISKLDEYGLCQMVLSGGEPLLRKDIFELIDYTISKTNILPHIVTNGTLITRHVARNLADHDILKDSIQVSLDGASEETHDVLRGRGSFRRTIQGIENLLSYGSNPTIGFVVTALNVQDISKLVDLAYNLGIRSLHFMPLMPSGKAKMNWKTLSLSKEQRNKVRHQIKEIRRNSRLKLIVDPALCFPPNVDSLELSDQEVKFIGCEAGRMELTITPRGDVIPCSLLRDHQFVAGNVRTTDIKQIWQTSQVFSMFRKTRFMSIFSNEKCNSCKLLKVCMGGCPATSYHLFGNLLERDAFCILYEDYL